MRYLALYGSFLKINIIRELQFRVNLVVHFFCMLLEFLGNMLFYYFLYHNVDSIAGWNKYEIYILAATVIIVNAVFGGVFFVNMIQIPRKVKTYDLDYLILKPVSTVFYLSFHEFDMGLFSGMFFGVALLSYSIVKSGISFRIGNVLLYMLLVSFGVLILYSVLFFWSLFRLNLYV